MPAKIRRTPASSPTRAPALRHLLPCLLLVLSVTGNEASAQHADSAKSGPRVRVVRADPVSGKSGVLATGILTALSSDTAQILSAPDGKPQAVALGSNSLLQYHQRTRTHVIAGMAIGTIAGLLVAGKPESCKRFESRNEFARGWEATCRGSRIATHVTIVTTGTVLGGLICSAIRSEVWNSTPRDVSRPTVSN
jgi:hypothetical protein